MFSSLIRLCLRASCFPCLLVSKLQAFYSICLLTFLHAFLFTYCILPDVSSLCFAFLFPYLVHCCKMIPGCKCKRAWNVLAIASWFIRCLCSCHLLAWFCASKVKWVFAHYFLAHLLLFCKQYCSLLPCFLAWLVASVFQFVCRLISYVVSSYLISFLALQLP